MIIDAHLHINTHKEKPVQQLITEMNEHAVDGGVLILNTPEEQLLSFREKSVLIEHSNKIKVAIGMNPHSRETQEIYESLASLNKGTKIAKIHPRLMGITDKDFSDIESLLCRYGVSTVIIDTLVYGPRYEYNCGVELGIYLAENMPSRRVVLAHSGSTRLLECMMMTRWLPNIYYDYSFICPYFLSTSIGIDMLRQLRCTDERVIFGSDYPSFAIEAAKTSFLQLCHDADYSSEQIEKVMYRNACKIYGF